MTIYKRTFAPSYNSNLSLTEVGQSRSVRFALAEYNDEKQKLQQLHLSVKCRDYFAEILHGSVTKKDYLMYGFKWEGSKYQLNPEKTGIMVFIGNKEQRQSFVDNFETLVEWEKFTGFGTLPELHDVDKEPSDHEMYFVKCDPKWFSNTFTISLFTLLLRCLCYPKVKSMFPVELAKSLPPGNDQNLLNSIASVAKVEAEMVFTDPKFLFLDNNDGGLGWGNSPGTSLIHDYGGIYSFFNAVGKYKESWKSTAKNNNIQAFLKAVA